MLGVNITPTKFAPEVVKFCCDGVCVDNSVSEVKGYQLKRLLQNVGGDAKFSWHPPPHFASGASIL